jgi:hypothetical protein
MLLLPDIKRGREGVKLRQSGPRAKEIEAQERGSVSGLPRITDQPTGQLRPSNTSGFPTFQVADYQYLNKNFGENAGNPDISYPFASRLFSLVLCLQFTGRAYCKLVVKIFRYLVLFFIFLLTIFTKSKQTAGTY